jgi:small subunit ribosomal protein S11
MKTDRELTTGRDRTKRGSRKSRKKKSIQYAKKGAARCRVTCGMNNTKVVRTWYDSASGKVRNRVKTAGAVGYPNAKRGTVYAAQTLVAKVAKEYRERRPGKGIHLRRRGMGKSRGSIRKALEKTGRRRLTVSDATKDPHNGCRRKKARRI